VQYKVTKNRKLFPRKGLKKTKPICGIGGKERKGFKSPQHQHGKVKGVPRKWKSRLLQTP